MITHERRIVDDTLDEVLHHLAAIALGGAKGMCKAATATRRAVDDDRTGGRFLLAGSVGVASGVRVHSGAGRIVRMALRPLTISERGLRHTRRRPRPTLRTRASWTPPLRQKPTSLPVRRSGSIESSPSGSSCLTLWRPGHLPSPHSRG